MRRVTDLDPEMADGKGVAGLDVIRHSVGLRPVREGGIRLEKEVSTLKSELESVKESREELRALLVTEAAEEFGSDTLHRLSDAKRDVSEKDQHLRERDV